MLGAALDPHHVLHDRFARGVHARFLQGVQDVRGYGQELVVGRLRLDPGDPLRGHHHLVASGVLLNVFGQNGLTGHNNMHRPFSVKPGKVEPEQPHLQGVVPKGLPVSERLALLDLGVGLPLDLLELVLGLPQQVAGQHRLVRRHRIQHHATERMVPFGQVPVDIVQLRSRGDLVGGHVRGPRGASEDDATVLAGQVDIGGGPQFGDRGGQPALTGAGGSDDEPPEQEVPTLVGGGLGRDPRDRGGDELSHQTGSSPERCRGRTG